MHNTTRESYGHDSILANIHKQRAKTHGVYYIPTNNSYINMHQGNWKCSTCGGAITELPFQPRSESGLTCRACYGKQKGGNAPQAQAPEMSTANEAPDIPFEAGLAGEPDFDDGFGPAVTPTSSSEKPRTSGNWQCAGCGAAINSLPFTPRDTGNLKCIDCFKKSRG